MQMQMPQEIEVWFILPALRRELAKSMIADHRLSQKQVAGIMGITEAAVSQYLKSKRAKDVKFSKQTVAEIKTAAKNIVTDNTHMMSELLHLCNLSDVKHLMCKLHKSQFDIDAKCNVCFEGDLIKLTVK